jgi:hypothetical protein
MPGCDELAAVEEDVVTAFTDVCSDDNNRITVKLNRAYKVSPCRACPAELFLKEM